MDTGRTERRSTGPTGRDWPGSCAGSEPAKQAQQLSGAKENKQIVTSITEGEEQLAGFTQLLELVASSTGQLEALLGG